MCCLSCLFCSSACRPVCPPVSLSCLSARLSVLSVRPSLCLRSCLAIRLSVIGLVCLIRLFRLRSCLPIRLFVFGLVCLSVFLSSVLSAYPSFCLRSCLPIRLFVFGLVCLFRLFVFGLVCLSVFLFSVLSAYSSFCFRSCLPIRLFVFGLVCLFVFLFSVLSAYSFLLLFFFFVFGLCPSVSLSSVLSVSPFLSFGQIYVRLLLFEWMCVFTAFLRIYPVWLSAYVPTYLSLLT